MQSKRLISLVQPQRAEVQVEPKNSDPLVVLPGDGTRVSMLGQPLEVRLSGEKTGGSYAITEAQASAGWGGAPPHRHLREDEMIYVIEGELLVSLDGRETRVGSGAIIHIPKGCLHTFCNPTDAPARLLTLYTPAGFEEVFSRVGEPLDDHPQEQRQSLSHARRLSMLSEEFHLELEEFDPELPDAS